MGSKFRNGFTKSGTPFLDISHRNATVTIIPEQNGNFLTAQVTRRLSNIDNYPIEESKPIFDLESELVDVFDELGPNNISLDVMTETGPDGAVDYYDGYKAVKPIFVDDDFGLREFDEAIMELEQISRAAFRQTNSELDIETDLEEAAGSEDDPERSPPGFQ